MSWSVGDMETRVSWKVVRDYMTGVTRLITTIGDGDHADSHTEYIIPSGALTLGAMGTKGKG